MANVISSALSKVVIEVEGVEVTFVQARGGPKAIARKGRPGKRDWQLAIHLEPKGLERAAALAAAEFRRHSETAHVGEEWSAPVHVSCVALDALGELAGGSARETPSTVAQLELFPKKPEYFGTFGRED